MSYLTPTSFYKAYLLAGRVQRKLERDASKPTLGLRMLVCQANMLDRLMEDIDDYTHARYSQHQQAVIALQKKQLAQSLTIDHSQRLVRGPMVGVDKPQVQAREVDLDLSDDEDFLSSLDTDLDSELDTSDDGSDEFDAPDELAQLVYAVTQQLIRNEASDYDDSLKFEEKYFCQPVPA